MYPPAALLPSGLLQPKPILSITVMLSLANGQSQRTLPTLHSRNCTEQPPCLWLIRGSHVARAMEGLALLVWSPFLSAVLATPFNVAHITRKAKLALLLTVCSWSPLLCLKHETQNYPELELWLSGRAHDLANTGPRH